MLRTLAVLALVPSLALAAPDHAAIARRALDGHILPRVEALAIATGTLAETARGFCAASGSIDGVLAAYQAAFDAWAGASHLRFGATEEENRAFAISFWPDDKGYIPRTIDTMIRDGDPVVDDPASFRDVSVAGRGLFALDYLLYDEPAAVPDDYRCRLLMALAGDLAETAGTIAARWRDPYGGYLTTAGATENPLYLDAAEATQELFKALMTGFETNLDLRLGRPLGSFDRARPTRAEAWRSGRPLRNIVLSVESLRDFASIAFWPELAAEDRDRLEQGFARVLEIAARLPEPIEVAVTTPQGRFRVEALQSALRDLRDGAAASIGPALGVGTGFNALDGD